MIIFWIICLIFNIHIELAKRQYPLLFIPVIEALGGTLAISLLSKWLISHKAFKPLQTVGKHTLAVMCIHHLDLYWINWGNFIHWWPVAIVARLLVDLTILVIFLFILKITKISDV